VIDTFSNSVVATIPVGTLPWGVAIDAVDNLIYVTNYGSGTVSIIDGFTNSLCVPTRCTLNTITVGSNPEGIALNLVLSQAYVANSGSNTVSVINITSDTVFATVPVGSSPQSVAVGSAQPKPPNSQPYTVFVTNYGSNTISVIPVGSPYLTFPVTTVTVGNNPWGVVVNPYTNRVYVTNSGSGTVTVLNGSSFSTISTISLGPGSTPEGIDIDTSSSKAYVANPASNTVSVIDLTTNTVLSSTNPPIPMPVGIGPWGVATVIPSLNVLYPSLAYVTNSGTNTVSVIDLATNEVITAIVVS
jgi:YVTN family beta-propeller protein